MYLILSCDTFPKSWGCPWSLVCQVFHHVVLWKPTAEVDQAQKANRGSNVPRRSVHPSIPLQRVKSHPSFPARSTLFTQSFQTPFLTDSYFYINLSSSCQRLEGVHLNIPFSTSRESDAPVEGWIHPSEAQLLGSLANTQSVLFSMRLVTGSCPYRQALQDLLILPLGRLTRPSTAVVIFIFLKLLFICLNMFKAILY